jgi:hypothetical protein
MAHEAAVAAEAEAVAHIVEDDDMLNLPAPSPEAFAHRPALPRPKRELLSRTLGFKQTLIPILLTLGVLLAGSASWSFAIGEESPISGELLTESSLLIVGLLLLAFGVFTMFQVRSQLNSATPATVR